MEELPEKTKLFQSNFNQEIELQDIRATR